MEVEILRKLGLNATQAKTYLEILKHETVTPTELAEILNEPRSTIYSVIDRLAALELIKKIGHLKKLEVQAENPNQIKKLLIRRQKSLKVCDSELKILLPDMLAEYRLAADNQSAFILDGADQLTMIWDDIIRDKKPVHIISGDISEYTGFIVALRREIIRQQKAGLEINILANEKSIFKSIENINLAQLEKPLPGNTIILAYEVTTVFINLTKSSITSSVIINQQTADFHRSIFDTLSFRT